MKRHKMKIIESILCGEKKEEEKMMMNLIDLLYSLTFRYISINCKFCYSIIIFLIQLPHNFFVLCSKHLFLAHFCSIQFL